MTSEVQLHELDAGSACKIRILGTSARAITVRALDTSRSTGERILLLDIETGADGVRMLLSAGEAAGLMFELGFALEEAARIAARHLPGKTA